MATMTIHAREGDTLDALLWRERGLGPAEFAGVLTRNPGLAARGAVLPAGTPVVVPAPVTAATPTLPLIQLWD